MESNAQRDVVTTVREFFAAQEAGSIKEAMSLVHPDIVWKNTRLPDVRGARRVGKLLQGLGSEKVRLTVVMHHIAPEGDSVVLTDRTDILHLGPVSISFWVVGTFEFDNGEIILWDDRFSWANYLRGVIVGLTKAVLGR